jgi:hypothetical protein
MENKWIIRAFFIALYFFVGVIMYLCFSFVEWETNPEFWDRGNRQFLAVVIAVTTLFLTTALRKIEELDKKNQ